MPPNLQQKKTMRKPVKLALAQIAVESGEPERNLDRADAAISEAAVHGTDIVLLPEAMDLGWAYPFAKVHAEAVPGGSSVVALQEMAARHQLWVCAGLTELDAEDSSKCYNAAVLVDTNGNIRLHHRKIHELNFAREVYATGDRLSVCDTEFGRMGLMICADAFVDDRVISRSLGQMGAKLILSPCAWAVPEDHDNSRDPYGQLWRDAYVPVAREFGMWIAGVSNVGSLEGGDWSGRKCIGCSMLIAPDGATNQQAPYGEHAGALLYAEIELS